MGTAVPENGGAMVWARAAFGAGTFMGDGVAFLAGWMSFLFTAVDAALYPSMFVSYLSAGEP
jgi:amino acid transporter